MKEESIYWRCSNRKCGGWLVTDKDMILKKKSKQQPVPGMEQDVQAKKILQENQKILSG